jgi:hypothetical protein
MPDVYKITSSIQCIMGKVTWQESLTSTQYQYKYTHIYTNKHSVYQTQYNISNC